MQIRVKMSQPSDDCLVQRARLKFVARLVSNAPDVIPALLALKPKGKNLQWVDLVLDDFRMLQSRVLCHSELLLPDPVVDPDAWSSFMIQWRTPWAQYVDRLFYVESVTDRRNEATPVTNQFSCNMCAIHFDTQKALASHCRVAHKQRCSARHSIGADRTCLVCKATFGCRTRAIAHLTDARRIKCSSRLSEFAQITDAEVQQLDALDRDARNQARKQGFSQPHAAGKSVDSIGRVKWNL